MTEVNPIQPVACSTCPFRKKAKIIGARDYLIDVARMLLHKRVNHSCHRTDPEADGYVGGEKKQCLGILKVLDNEIGDKKHKDFFNNFMDFFKYHKSEGKIDAND